MSDTLPVEEEVVRRPTRLGAFIEKRWVPPFFLLATIMSLFLMGLENGVGYYAALGEEALLFEPRVLLQGAIYAGALIAILGTHEMGHWLVARAHGVKTSLPVFIPMPLFIGTFGAIIGMKELPPTRRALIRIGAAGPLAGGVVALVAMTIAIATSPTVPFANFAELQRAQPGTVTLEFGESLATLWLARLFSVAAPEGYTTLATPLFSAAWVGFLLTSINLFPIGQLDGGHVLYGLIGERAGRWARPMAILVILLAIPGALFGYGLGPTYILWGVILFFFIAWHPPVPTPEERLPLDTKILAALCLLLLVATFMVTPLKVLD